MLKWNVHNILFESLLDYSYLIFKLDWLIYSIWLIVRPVIRNIIEHLEIVLFDITKLFITLFQFYLFGLRSENNISSILLNFWTNLVIIIHPWALLIPIKLKNPLNLEYLYSYKAIHSNKKYLDTNFLSSSCSRDTTSIDCFSFSLSYWDLKPPEESYWRWQGASCWHRFFEKGQQ